MLKDFLVELLPLLVKPGFLLLQEIGVSDQQATDLLQVLRSLYRIIVTDDDLVLFEAFNGSFDDCLKVAKADSSLASQRILLAVLLNNVHQA